MNPQRRGKKTVSVQNRGEEECKCCHQTKLQKNQETPQYAKKSNFGCKNGNNQEHAKVIWSDTRFTRRLLIAGERIQEFGECLSKQLRVLKSVELHPSDPNIGFICFTHAAPIKRLEKILIGSGIKGLQVRASERVNRWKDFFKSPNDFFPAYQRVSTKPEHNNQTQQAYQQSNLNANDTTAAVESNTSSTRPNQTTQPQQIIIIKQEDDEQCRLGMKQELEPPSCLSTNHSEKYEQQSRTTTTTSNLVLNSNSNSNQNIPGLYAGAYCSQSPPQLTSAFNQTSIKSNHNLPPSLSNTRSSQIFEKPKPLIAYNESQIYIEITQILRRNRSWESLLELVRYVESSEWISSTRKAQMLFAIGEKREALENVMQLNQLYGQEKAELS